MKKFQELKDQNIILKIAATSNPVDLTGSVIDDMFVMAADLMFQDPTDQWHNSSWASPHAWASRSVH